MKTTAKVMWRKHTSVILIVLATAVIIISNRIWCHLTITSQSRNWPQYQQTYLRSQATFIQQSFSAIETHSKLLLKRIISSPAFVDTLEKLMLEPGSQQEYQPRDLARRFLFETLFRHAAQAGAIRGIAVYAADKTCVARQGWFFQIPAYWLEEALTGSCFSAITESEGRVYVALCTFYPIARNSSPGYAGVAVAFTPLDTHYPLSSRYIKSESFALRMLSQTGLQDVKILFCQQRPTVRYQRTLVCPLVSHNGERLAWMTLTALPLDVQERNLYLQSQTRERMTAGVAILLLFVIFLRRFKNSQHLSLGTRLGCLLVLFGGLRLGWLLLAFPHDLVPASFRDPAVFYSSFLGDCSTSLTDLLVSALVLLGWLVWSVELLAPALPRWRWLQSRLPASLVLLGCLAGSIWFLRFARWVIGAIVQHAHLLLFDPARFFPSLEAFSLYIVLLAFGIALLKLLELSGVLLRSTWQVLELGAGVRGLVILALAGLALSAQSHSWHWGPLLTISVFTLVLCGFPRQWSLAWQPALLVIMAGLAIYPLVLLEVRAKKHTIIEDRARKNREQILQDTLDQTLSSFEHNQFLVKGLQSQKNNLAFLLWANSPLLTALDNLNVVIYNSQEEIISHFAFNMPPAEWYPVITPSFLKQKKPVLISEYGLGQGHTTKFLIGMVPIRNATEQIIGRLLLLTQVRLQPWALPVPKVFANNPPSTVEPFEAQFVRHTLTKCNNPDIPLSFRPRSDVVAQVYHHHMKIWVHENIAGREYENYYFADFSNGQQQMRVLGYPVQGWQKNLFYLLQLLLSGLVILLLGALLRLLPGCWRASCWRWRPSFEQKLLACFLISSALPMVILGLMSKERAVQAIQDDYAEKLKEFLRIAERTFRAEQSIPLAPDDFDCQTPDDIRCRAWAQRYGRIINYYLQDRLIATSHRELFDTELLSTGFSGEVYYNLMLLKKEFYITYESIGEYPFVVGYKILVSGQDARQVVGAIAIPMLYRQEEIQKALINVASWIFTLYVVLFSGILALGIFLAHKITRPLAKLLEGTRRVSSGDLNFSIPVHARDEIGLVVESFNQMTRALKVSQAKLVQAEKDAAWREMARRIAHEIKNPLTPMKLAAQHILRAYHDRSPKFDQILPKGLNTIIDSIENLARTASSFSEFAKFDQPKLEYLRLEPIIAKTLELFSHYRSQNYDLQVTIEPHLPLLLLNADQMQRVLINLLTNAVQAMEQGGVIHLVVARQGDKVILKVQDNGPGIPEPLRDHIFEPNFSTKSSGSGLGLAITKRIIERFAGQINVTSASGQGTTFQIVLPIPDMSDGHS